MRFDDQADFLCAFILDELDGRAEGRWYFGAFRRFRQADAAATIDAALAAHPDEVAAVLGRLARRGRLDDLLARIGAGRLLAIGGGARTSSSAAPDVAVLVATALDLLTRLGWTLGDGDRRTLVQALTRHDRPAAPEWTDRRRLSAFVWSCVEDCRRDAAGRGASRARRSIARRSSTMSRAARLARRAVAARAHRRRAMGVTLGASAPRPPDALAIVLGRIAQQVMAGHVAGRPR